GKISHDGCDRCRLAQSINTSPRLPASYSSVGVLVRLPECAKSRRARRKRGQREPETDIPVIGSPSGPSIGRGFREGCRPSIGQTDRPRRLGVIHYIIIAGVRSTRRGRAEPNPDLMTSWKSEGGIQADIDPTV